MHFLITENDGKTLGSPKMLLWVRKRIINERWLKAMIGENKAMIGFVNNQV